MRLEVASYCYKAITKHDMMKGIFYQYNLTLRSNVISI